MKLKRNFLGILYIVWLIACLPLGARSKHRTGYDNLPQITVSWSDSAKASFTLRDSHLEQYPLFELFDEPYFKAHLLPLTPISDRYDAQKTIDGALLNEHIECLLKEIKARKRKYTHFKVLTGKNFNRRKGVGMVILKYNHGSIIIKLSTETPRSFNSPFGKGLDNIWFFPMGGGINRHLAGLTRVKNRENVKQKLMAEPQWSSRIDVPRKWYWLPSQPRYLHLVGTNIGNKATQTIDIPATYAIVTDAIAVERELELNNEEDTALALNVCNFLEHAIDAHINNFVVEKNTGKIVIIDTEHFPSVIGIKEKVHVDSYVDWYGYLIRKCSNDWLFRTKKERLTAQRHSQTIKLI